MIRVFLTELAWFPSIVMVCLPTSELMNSWIVYNLWNTQITWSQFIPGNLCSLLKPLHKVFIESLLNNDLQNITEWAHKRKMPINSDPTKQAIIYFRPNPANCTTR